MQIQVHYQGLDNTPWMDQFITNRVNKLSRYLSQGATVQVNVRQNKAGIYSTSLAIHNPYHDYAFSSDGGNLYESFATAIQKATRALSEHKRKIKDRINKRYFSIKKEVA